MQEPIFSTSICNECVLNINNFYTFKKKILEAQQLINTLNAKNDIHNEHPAEYVEDAYHLQVVEMTEDSQLLLEMGNDCVTENSEKIELPRPNAVQVTRLVKVDNVKKRTNEANNQKTSNKKAKVEQTPTEKIIIQMNECLICPAILGDILQLKDHIDAHATIKCKACGRIFARYSNLKRHFNSTHSKPKPFQCDLCGLGFNFSVNLQSHAALHYSGKIRKEW